MQPLVFDNGRRQGHFKEEVNEAAKGDLIKAMFNKLVLDVQKHISLQVQA